MRILAVALIAIASLGSFAATAAESLENDTVLAASFDVAPDFAVLDLGTAPELPKADTNQRLQSAVTLKFLKPAIEHSPETIPRLRSGDERAAFAYTEPEPPERAADART
jgi:hypothetical protein